MTDKNGQEQSEKMRYIFVVGNSRSGTTMMGRIIGNHPEVSSMHELHYFEQLTPTNELEKKLSFEAAQTLLMRLFTIKNDGYSSQGNPERFKDEADNLLKSMTNKDWHYSIDVFKSFMLYESQKVGRKYPCEDTPQNVFYIKEILHYLPEARIVNMIRDPRDVLLSQKRRWKRRFLGHRNLPWREVFRYWFNYHPITIARLWNSAIRAADFHKDHPQVCQLRFEDLLEAPEEKVKELCDFTGLKYHEKMVNVPQIGSSTGVDYPEKKGIDPKVAGRWKKGGLTPVEIYLCQRITRENMSLHGYPTSDIKPPLIPLILALITFPLKLTVAFFMNLGRMRNVIETLKRRFM